MAIADHQPGVPPNTEKWKLYNLDVDFSATHDVALTNARTLSWLQGLWQHEAQKYKVLPVENVSVLNTQFFAGNEQKVSRYPASMTLPLGTGPQLTNKSFSLVAQVYRVNENAEGVLVAQGDRFGGFSLFIKSNFLHFDFNEFGKHSVIISNTKIPTEKSMQSYSFKKTRDFHGVGTLKINGQTVGQIIIDITPALVTTWAGTDIGLDEGSPVSETYSSRKGFAFPAGQMSEMQIMVY